MTERDELARAIGNAIIEGPMPDGSYAAYDTADLIAVIETEHLDLKSVADAILAAGYRRPRVIETADELNKLPVGAVVLDGYNATCTKISQENFGWRRVTTAVNWGEGHWHKPYLPVTVLWEGGE